MKTLRIFISSPGDVAEERDRARQVVESLRRRYAGKFILKPLLWEDLPLQPDMSFQQGIDLVLSQDRGVDIAVFILWSRLGSPVGALIGKPGGGEYRSGTEREFELMMLARAQSGGARPAILLYTRRDESSFDERLRGRSTQEKADLLSQKQLVEQFIAEEFHDTGSGTNVRAYHNFDRPVTFSQRLLTHLQEILDELAGGTADVIWDTEKQGPPFMGLEAFQPQHADVFFGREQEILEARHALREQARNGCAFLLLSGASGSGKSSLARAGVLPAIRDNEIDEQVATWRSLIVTPADLAPDPIAALVAHLADVLPDLRGEAPLPSLAQDLRENPGITFRQAILPAFARASEKQKGRVRLLLLIDQLEEFFASGAISAEDRAAFFAVVEMLARSGSVWVLATVRSDFYQQMQTEPALVRLRTGHGQFDVLPPGPDALRRLIEDPARLAGLTFEERDGQSLAGRILRDAAAHAELLPLVEFVLRELYEQRTATRQLTFAAYEALGGVEGALARRAESTFRSLPGDSQETLAAVLQSLITLGSDSDSPIPDNANGERLVRQRAPLSTFTEKAAARRFVDTFVSGRLFTSDQLSDASEPTITVAHESLLRVWPRALQWADQNRDFLRTRARVAARMKEDSPLLEGDPLLPAAQAHLRLQSAAFTPAQRDYIHHSTAAAEAKARRTTRRRRIAFTTLAALTLLAIAGAIFGWHQRGAAVKNEQSAKAETIRAETNLNKALSELDRATLEEGKVWLERARTSQQAGDHHTAKMFAGRAVGFRGYGVEKSIIDNGDRFLPLLGLPLEHNATAESERQAEQKAATFLLDRFNSFLPCWVCGQAGEVTSVAFSPDGTRLATGLWDKTVKVWNAASGKELATFSGHSNYVRSVVFSPDGTSLASGSGDDTVKVWDAASGKELATLAGHSDAVRSVAFSPDGTRLVSGSEDKTVKVWDVASGKELATLAGHSDAVGSVAISPDGTRLVSGSDDNTVKIWDAVSGKELATLAGHSDAVGSVAISPDGTRLASGSKDNTVKVWETSSGKELATLLGHSSNVQSVTFSPDGNRIASGSKDKTVRIWGADNGMEVASIARHSSFVESVSFSPDGTRLASGSWDKTVRVWDAAREKQLATLSGHSSNVRSVAFSPDGTRLVSGSEDKTVRLWDTASGKELATLSGHSAPVTAVAFSPDGTRLASGSNDTTLKVWDAASGKDMATLRGHSDDILNVTFSPEAGLLTIP